MGPRKKLATVFALIVLASAVCAFGCSSPDNENAIRNTIVQEFDSYKNMDQAAISKVLKPTENSGLEKLGITGEQYASNVLEGFDYSINDINIDGKTATADVTIVSKSMSDFETKFNALVDNIEPLSSSSSVNKEDITTTIGECAIEAFKETQLISENVTLQFELRGNTWVSTNASQALGDLDSMVFSPEA